MIYVLDYTFLHISGYLWLPLDILLSWGKPFYPQKGKITHPRIFIIHILYYCPSPDETVISSGKYVQKSLILLAFSGSQK